MYKSLNFCRFIKITHANNMAATLRAICSDLGQENSKLYDTWIETVKVLPDPEQRVGQILEYLDRRTDDAMWLRALCIKSVRAEQDEDFVAEKLLEEMKTMAVVERAKDAPKPSDGAEPEAAEPRGLQDFLGAKLVAETNALAAKYALFAEPDAPKPSDGAEPEAKAAVAQATSDDHPAEGSVES